MNPVYAREDRWRCVVYPRRAALHVRQDLGLIKANQLGRRKEAVRFQKCLQPPPCLRSDDSCRGCHPECAIKYNAQDFEVFALAECAEIHCWGRSPIMQFLLRCAGLLVDGFHLRHVFAARLVSLLRILIIRKTCFRETKLASGAVRIPIMYIPQRRPEHGSLENAIC